MCHEDQAIVRDFESDFGSADERIRSLDKAPRQIQVLRVRSNVSLRVERGYLSSGNERKTLRTMAFEKDGNYPRVSQILFQEARPWAKMRHALSI